MDFAKIFSRIKAILSTPQTEWPVIAAEPDSVAGLYRGYICIVAALPAIAHFIKGSLIGYGAVGVNLHLPLGMGLLGMVLRYLLTLLATYVVALVVNALAPTFGGQKDPLQGLKSVAYAWTAGWVGGVGVILPWIGWLVAIAGVIYGIYLLYLGLPHTMRCPQDKAGGYTAVTVIIAIVLSWIIGLTVAAMIGTATLGGASMTSLRVSDGHGGEVAVDPNTALGKIAAMSQGAQQAGKEIADAQKPGGGQVQSLSPDAIKAFLPETLAGLKRENFSAQRNDSMGVLVTTARADYGDGQGHDVQLEVADTGNMRGMMAMASAIAPDSEQQTEHGYQKTYTSNGRLVHESWDSQSKSGEYGVIVAQRYTVKASGNADSIDLLKQVVGGVDLDKLETLKNEGVSNQ
ncbi:YIP1 family protein [Dyella solisilvae]|uniref:YIP1 family protein n=1 Tax=Dyella solisilvae TaxID=1920168 RepID=A0A370K2Z0_9GAMM|nr:Yip1 family protein [Dyella solisilvae]RDI96999.1 YIP1 family protein [Dyella solisilvae]